ncbi:MAG: helix-turn-helix domain-containing protein [Bacilli bacterium]|nr:helix-turn-helix domain-containing protein [Bacilli bacterium]
MATKGQKFKKWTAEEKFEIIKPALDMKKSTLQITKETGLNNGMINNWIRTYREKGYEGLISKRKHNNPLAKYSHKKKLTKEEQLEYENMKLRIENELLKKGYLMKGDGTIVKFMK